MLRSGGNVIVTSVTYKTHPIQALTFPLFVSCCFFFIFMTLAQKNRSNYIIMYYAICCVREYAWSVKLKFMYGVMFPMEHSLITYSFIIPSIIIGTIKKKKMKKIPNNMCLGNEGRMDKMLIAKIYIIILLLLLMLMLLWYQHTKSKRKT